MKNKKTKNIKICETDLAQKLICYLQSNNYNNLYFEVYDNNEKRPIDVVVLLDNEEDNKTWAIEVKTCLNLNVILQAIYNKQHANYSSIFVPSDSLRKLKNYEYKTLFELLHTFGIGLLEYNFNSMIYETKKPTCKDIKNKINLHDKSKDSTAGAKHCKRETKFSTTVDLLINYVKENPNKRLSDIVKNIKHHYSSNITATNSLRTYIIKNVIKEIQINNGKCFIRNEYLA